MSADVVPAASHAEALEGPASMEQGPRPAGCPRRASGSEAALIASLTTALRVTRLYALEHPIVAAAVGDLARALEGFLARRHRAVLLVDDRRIYLNGRLVRARHDRWLDDLLDLLEQLGVGGLALAGSWDEAAVVQFLAGTVRARRDPPALAVRRLAAAAEGIPLPARAAVLDPLEAANLAREEEEGHYGARRLATFYYARLLALAEATYGEATIEEAPDRYGRPVRATLVRLLEHLGRPVFEQRVLALTARAARPAESPSAALARRATHVTLHCLLVAGRLDLRPARALQLGFAAFFHGLGEVGEDGASSARSGEGARCPAPSGDAPRVRRAARAIRRCLRGNTFGDCTLLRMVVAQEVNLRGHEPLWARPPHPFSALVAAAAQFERLQGQDGARAGLDPAAALAALARDAGSDPAAVEALQAVFGAWPRGSVVRWVPDGRLAVVLASGGGARWPIVRALDPAADDARTPDEDHDEADDVALEVDPAELELVDGEARQQVAALALARVVGPAPARLHVARRSGAAGGRIDAARALGTAVRPAASGEPEAERPEAALLLSDDGERAYEVGPELGRGAQGAVFEVSLLQGGDDLVESEGRAAGPPELGALKLAHPSCADALAREREIYARPRRGLVRMRDAGHAAGGDYLVLERLQPLPHQRFRTGRVDPATAVDLLLNLLEALAELHLDPHEPLVLCDIKPANVMLRVPCAPADAQGYLRALATGAYEPVFTDVGCALSRRELDANDGQVERMVGTPVYLPPESTPIFLGGEVLLGRYSPKTDVYALTLSFYELISGERPYARAGLYGRGNDDLLLEVFALKREHASPFDRRALFERFDRESAQALLDVLEAGAAPYPEARATAGGLARLVRARFDVPSDEDAAVAPVGLRARQARFPRVDPAGEHFYASARGDWWRSRRAA